MKNKLLFGAAIIILLGSLGGTVYSFDGLWFPSGGFLKPVVDTFGIHSTDDFRFDDEILPDGDICANGEILKKNAADDWNCATDSVGTGGASTTLDVIEDMKANGTTELKAFDWTLDTDGASSTLVVDGGAGFVSIPDLRFGSAGVKITGDGDGAFTWLGLGNGSDEDLTWNLDDTANTVVITTSTGVTALDWTAIGLTTGGLIRLDIDGSALNAAGSINFGGVATDSGIFFDGSNLRIETQTASGIILDSEDDTLEFKGSGTLQFTADLDGIDLITGNDYEINGASVLTATTLGSAVVNSSLTSLGTITTGTWNATDVGVADGGTGKSSWTQYLLLYADTTTSLAQVAIGTAGQVLTSAGAGAVAAFETISIAAGEYAAGSIDGDDVNSNIAGNYLTLTAASPDTLDLDVEVVEKAATINFGGEGFVASSTQFLPIKSAVTVQKVSCAVTADATATIQIEHRDIDDPYTASSTNVLSAELAVTPAVTASTTTFANAVLDADTIIGMFLVSASSTSVESLNCWIDAKTVDA